MKVAFLGNCQLNNVGILFGRMAQEKFVDVEVAWSKPVFELTNNDYLPLFHALDRADVIYIQYHDTYHGMYATNHLSKYFDMRIVPTLESFVSTPQMNNWSDRTPVPYNLGFIDYRILEMYLRDINPKLAADVYGDVRVSPGAVQALIDRSAFKYNDKFERKMVRFNYAPFYREAMRHDVESYFTMNHPSNLHLEWLVNNILADLGLKRKMTLGPNVPQLLGQFSPPSLRNDSRKGKYIINDVRMPLSTAVKMYYSYFDTLDTNFLEAEMAKSDYHAICSDEMEDSVAVMAQNFAAATTRNRLKPNEQGASDDVAISA